MVLGIFLGGDRRNILPNLKWAISPYLQYLQHSQQLHSVVNLCLPCLFVNNIKLPLLTLLKILRISLYVCMYIITTIYPCTYIHTYIHIYMCVYIYACVFMYMYLYDNGQVIWEVLCNYEHPQ